MRLTDLPESVNEISGQVIDAAIAVHKELGPGLLESAYKACLAHELRLRGHKVEREVEIAVIYRGLPVGKSYWADVVVEDCVVVEAKAAECLTSRDDAQLLTYLRWLNMPLGILLNFHAERIMRDGFRRRVFSPALREAPAHIAPPR